MFNESSCHLTVQSLPSKTRTIWEIYSKLPKKTVKWQHCTSFWCLYLLLLNYCKPSSWVFTVEFELVNASCKKWLSLTQNEKDILRLNNFLDFIIIIFSVIFII